MSFSQYQKQIKQEENKEIKDNKGEIINQKCAEDSVQIGTNILLKLGEQHRKKLPFFFLLLFFF